MYTIAINLILLIFIMRWKSPAIKESNVFEPRIIETKANDGNLRSNEETTSIHADYEQCSWIKSVLKTNDSIGKELPKPGTPRASGMFWLKMPLLHTKLQFSTIPAFNGLYEEIGSKFRSQIDDDGHVEVMILRYNIYSKDPSWVQHTEKYTNTVSVLEKFNFADKSIFPKLYGHCRDVDGFHTIVVEFINREMNDLGIPGTLERCIERSDAVLEIFQRLDEEYGLVLVDFKKGQWMSRSGYNDFVLQDVDDIVPAFSKNPYAEQVEWFKNGLVGRLGRSFSYSDVDRIWQLEMFPGEHYTIRYDILGLDILLNDLGFHWRESHCQGITNGFHSCLDEMFRWSKILDNSWPSFNELRVALGRCYEHRDHSIPPSEWSQVIRNNNERKPSLKRDNPVSEAITEYIPTNRCTRGYDSNDPRKDSWPVKWCEHSCCRSKGASTCYYTAPESSCGNLVH